MADYNSPYTGAQIDAAVAKVFNDDGWDPVNATWSYATATTITVPSGAASLYSIGDKWKLTSNGVVLQGYVIGVANTVLTVAGNVLTNHVFSNVFFSKSDNPQGFPGVFAYAPACTPQSGTYTSIRYLDVYFSMRGRLVTYVYNIDGTTNGTPTYIDVALPVPAVMVQVSQPAFVSAGPGLATINTSTGTMRTTRIGTSFSAGAYNGIAGVMIYKCA